MRVLVTGAAGQVGSELPGLLAHHEVVALGHGQLDLGDRDAVEQAVATALPDAVINCAAYTAVDAAESDPDAAYRVNALGVRHLASACRRVAAHLVHVSTDYVFDGEKDGPYDEYDMPSPRSVYGRSKWAGEQELARHAGSWALVRTAWVFGRVGRGFVEAILARARAGEPLRVVDDQHGSPTYAPDLAGVLARLATARREGLYHVVNGGTCTWHRFACEALELAGLEVAVEPITTQELGRPAPRPRNSVLTGRALAASGIGPLRHYREALADLVAQHHEPAGA